MISVENLKVEFGVEPLFEGVSYVINPRDRIALVGKNGAGKTTMLRILAGLQPPTDGIVSIPKDTRVCYLPQVMKLSDTRSVREETMSVFKRKSGEAEMTDDDGEAYRQLAEMERTLKGLGFRADDLDRPTSEFSGGWRMRIELAKLLLQHPDVLLLDEPTNHLDIDSIQWLEGFLARNGKAVMLVSHDRAFINNVTNRTIEISCGTIYDYRVKYDEFVRLRRERREQQLRAYENQQREIAETREFIERFRYKPTKAVQVQSRIKWLEKVVPIKVDEEDRSQLRLKFQPAQRSGNYPVICDDVRKAYGDHVVFSGVNLTIKRGEKVAFVGRNGEGKTTLVKCIMGEIPFDGKLTIGHNVTIGYFAQNQAQLLDEELTVFDTIDRAAVGDIRLKIRDILGAFMFGGEASDKKVKVLSGGERSRLAMIKLLLESVNLLILDEPTNHLDMRSKDVLKEAIRDFGGTVIVVSHDREFLDGLVSKVYEFADGHVREHLGGIYDYLRKAPIQQASPLPFPKGKGAQQERVPINEKNATGQAAPFPSGEGRGEAYEARKEQLKQRKKLERAVEEAEKKVTKLEAELKELEGWMATPSGAANTALYESYAQLKEQLSAAETAWEEAMMKLEEI
ncbi:MAG: ABC-F family ATP-binding cassette domain-containing protein [Bacteroidaceae bacterium]|nr:ABC-F family ATP-binding cassette domain-containing protein [Bacteroidaceae bacterium]